MNEISSATNSHYRQFLSLTENKGIKKEGLFLLSGKNLVAEFLANPNLQIVAELFTEKFPAITKKETGAKLFKLPQELFENIDVVGTHSSILVLKTPETPKWDPTLSLSGLTVATPLGDPNNLGALIRSCQAFGASQVLLLEESANPYLPKSVKASAGAVLQTKFYKGPKLSEFVQNKNLGLVGLDMNGKTLPEFQWPKDSFLILGEEGSGLIKNSNMKLISVPTSGKVESLNATVAASLALYDYFIKVKNR